MNHAAHTEAEHSFLDTLKNCAALFVSLSSALLIAFLAMRVMEFFAISTTANLPEDIRTVIAQALLFDSVAILKMLPFLFVPFFIVCVITRTNKLPHLGLRGRWIDCCHRVRSIDQVLCHGNDTSRRRSIRLFRERNRNDRQRRSHDRFHIYLAVCHTRWPYSGALLVDFTLPQINQNRHMHLSY